MSQDELKRLRAERDTALADLEKYRVLYEELFDSANAKFHAIAERVKEACAETVLEHARTQRFWADEKADDAPAAASMHQIEAMIAARCVWRLRKLDVIALADVVASSEEKK